MSLKSQTIIVLFGILMIVLGCGENQSKTSKGTIGITVMSLSNPYFKELAEAAQEEALKFGFEVIIASGDFDPSKQRNQISDFITKDVDAIILTPVDSKSSGVSVRKCNEMGIPVFTADLATSDSLANVVAHIATDNYMGGRQAGDAMIEAIKTRNKKIMILDFPPAESCVKRIAGFRDRIGEYNLANPLDQFNIVTQLPCGGQRDIAFKATSDVIQAHPDLVGIFAINDPGALGAVGALEKVNRLDDITIIGFDGQPEGKVAIRDGKIYADPIQFPKRIGRQTVQTIMKYLNGHEVEKTQLIETVLYRQEDGLNDPDIKDYR